MSVPGWRVVGETEAGGVWAAVAEHPPVDVLDRTHIDPQTTLGLWLSPRPNGSLGRFLSPAIVNGHSPLGRIVVVPGDLPLHVRETAAPGRRMLHCRLPARLALPIPLKAALLEQCLNLRNPSVAASLSRLAYEVTEPGFANAAMIESLGLQVAAELARDFAGACKQAKGGLASWQMRRIDEYIQSGHWNCSVSDLAALCGISPSHAMRAFRQSSARTLTAHIALLRINRARDLLASEDSEIAEVSAILRFASPSSFSAAFRRMTGETPKHYRSRMRDASR
jgi:AraC family transcriptional regulator